MNTDPKIWDSLRSELIIVIQHGFEIDSDKYKALNDADKRKIVANKVNSIVMFFYNQTSEDFINDVLRA